MLVSAVVIGGSSSGGTAQAQKFRPRGGVAAQCAEHRGGNELRRWKPDATARHAEMVRHDNHADSPRSQMRLYGMCDLLGHALLDLESASKAVNEPGQFADADDFAREISDVRDTLKWQHVVLAYGVKVDSPQDDQFVRMLGERRRQDLLRRFSIARRHFQQRLHDTRRRVDETVPVRILTDDAEENLDGTLSLERVRAFDPAKCSHSITHLEFLSSNRDCHRPQKAGALVARRLPSLPGECGRYTGSARSDETGFVE
jgi:hypothetical protein